VSRRGRRHHRQRGGGRPQHAHGPDSGRHRADGRGDEHLAEAVAGEAQRHRAPAQVRRVSARRYLDHLASTGEAEVRAKLAGGPGRPERRFRVV
jgi:hypothetical protein